jgi:hypothetical protein
MSSSKNPHAERLSKYFNGPAGKETLDTLDEGDNFILQVRSDAFRITKKNGRAVVEVIRTS